MENNNKLIAEFLGYKPNTNGVYPIVCINEGEGWHLETMKFNYDWNWLMKVVEKIESLPNELCNKYFWNKEGKQQNDFRIFRVQKIDDLYNQCIEFIKWYNEQ